MATVPFLTTTDNPYDPADQFHEWYAYDRFMGYDTVDLMGRIIVTGDALSPADQEHARVLAIEEIARENVTGMYRIVYREE